MSTKPKIEAVNDQATVQLIANFLRQIAETDWSKKDLKELADAVETGGRKVAFDPDYSLRKQKCRQ